MISVKRYDKNPILMPNKGSDWEAFAVLNGSVVKNDATYYMLYRAISSSQQWEDEHMHVSSIGKATSSNGLDFSNSEQFMKPEYEWERYGCEDPRVIFIDGRYLIFYTAISTNPPSPSGIRIGVAISKDLQSISEKHLVTPFNAKAMVLFPEKINGKFVGLLTADTDNPPAKIALCYFDDISKLWERSYWENWYQNISTYTLPLLRRSNDQVEVGLVPVKTPKGWVFVYSYIQNYFSNHKVFGIEAVLLDLDDPLKIVARTNGPFMVPEDYAEKYGTIPNIIFPSGGHVEGDSLRIYYGASDTAICAADVSLSSLVSQMISFEPQIPLESVHSGLHLVRFEGNPILEPVSSHSWEEKAVLNAGIYTKDRTIYILYRAMNNSEDSSIGLATTLDGYHINDRLSDPIYTPREPFEINPERGAAGCEDPRLTQIEDRIYMHYTGYNGSVARVVHTSILEKDFLERNFNKWETPIAISDPSMMDKNSAIFPEKIKGKFVVLHRLDVRIWIDFVSDFSELGNGKWLEGSVLCAPRANMWDSEKVGTAGPPIRTELGWMLLYHGISSHDHKYRLGILILDIKDPTKIIFRLNNPILEPKLWYENQGVRPGTVFSCGSSIINDTLFVYYGAGDSTVGVAKIDYKLLIESLKDLMQREARDLEK